MKTHTQPAVLLTTLGVLLSGCMLHDAGTGPSARRAGPQAEYRSFTAVERDKEHLPQQQDKELPEGAGLRDYLVYAALNNPGLEASFDRWKAALERVPQVKSLPDPRFTYRLFIEQVETRVGAQRQGFGLSQTLPWFGKLALRGDAAAEAARAERQRFEADKLELFYRVKDAYFEYYFLWRAIGIVKENIQLLKQIERVARTRYKVAAASHPSVIRAQVELGKLDDRLRSLEDLRGPIAARLNAAMNRPAGAPVPWPKAIQDRPVSVTDGQLLGWLRESNPQLQAMDYEIAASKHKIELAKKDYYPDVTVGLDYIDTATSVGGMNPGDDGKDPIVGMISINLPIWREKLAAAVRETRFRHRAAARAKTQKANSLSAALKLVVYRFRDAERKIDLYRDTLLPKARQSVSATQTSFSAGKATFTDLIDAERIFLEFALAYERALADRAQRLGELEMLVGKEIPRGGEAKTKSIDRADQSTKQRPGGDSHD